MFWAFTAKQPLLRLLPRELGSSQIMYSQFTLYFSSLTQVSFYLLEGKWKLAYILGYLGTSL